MLVWIEWCLADFDLARRDVAMAECERMYSVVEEVSLVVKRGQPSLLDFERVQPKQNAKTEVKPKSIER